MKERVGLVFDNSAKCAELLLDIWNNGDSVVFADWRIPKARITEMLRMCDVKKCYIDVDIYSKWNQGEKEADSEIAFIAIKDDFKSVGVLPDGVMNKYKPDYSENEALILFSSGTTGKSKGIILSHKAIELNADAVISYMKLDKEDVFYIVKTLAHSSTIVGELLVALKTHHKVVLSPSVYSPIQALRNINKYNVSVMCLNPTLLGVYGKLLSSSKISVESLKTVYVSGAVLSEALFCEASMAFGGVQIFNVYGLTEAGPRVTAQYKGGTWKAGSVGKPVNGVEIIVVNENGVQLHDGEKGIVHVNTNCICKGYVSNVPVRKSIYEGWLNTGDVGYINEGELFITARWDNMIIQGSHNIYPEDVERTISLMPEIDECIIFSIEDDISGEIMICYYTAEENIGDKLKDYCMEELATYEIPKEFYKVASIPKTENGKASRRLAKEKYEHFCYSQVMTI